MQVSLTRTELEKLESLGLIDPIAPGFDPKRALKIYANHNGQNQVRCETVKEAVGV